MQPFFEQDSLSLYCGDLRKVLPMLPEASVDFVCTDPPYGLGFMAKDWDHEVLGPEYWRAVARVCKPGALLLAFGGTRTYHRLVCAIEDADWEIRDCLMWLYGQGFPKAADVGKMIDKARGAERQVIGDKLDRPGYHLHEGRGNGCYGGGNGLHAPGTDARLRAAQITAPATPEAARWTGWASALKPAWEPIVLAMKPTDGTIANNALTWGVAGMNIDAGRIGWPMGEVPSIGTPGWGGPQKKLTVAPGADGKTVKRQGPSSRGRWPANLLLDENAAAQLDEQTGGASRFFYCSKATKNERGLDNNHPTVKPVKLMEYLLTLLSTPNGGVILDPFAGSGTTLLAAKRLGRRCIGVELTEHNCEIAVSRLKGQQ